MRQIRELRPDQAATERPVRLRGVVTAISGWHSSFFFSDSTAGISVDRAGATSDLQAGQLVELTGVTAQGKFAPVVSAKAVRILGAGRMPTAKLASLADLSGGALDSQWVAVQGIVHRAEVKPQWGHDVLMLDMDIGGGLHTAVQVRHFDKDAWRALPASIISLQGVCGTVFNDKRQFIALRFFVERLDDIRVLHPGPKDLFDRPLTELSNIGSFHAGGNGADLLRVRGVVTDVQGDGKVYLQNGTDSVLVQTNHEAGWAQGSEIEAVGFPRDGDYSPYLEEAAFRRVGTDAQPVKPQAVNAADMILDRDGFASSPFDGSLVRVKGTLQQMIPGGDDTVLFLQDGGTVFTARLAKTAAKRGLPAIGSVVDLTGVCVTKIDSGHVPNGFRILLRSATDITVLQSAPWWTAEHAKSVVTIMATALGIMFLILTLAQRDATLRQLSQSDALTGLHNRRGFVALAEQQWQTALRKKTSMLVFYIDVDRFKEINDRLGHKQGDLALQTVASILHECFRKSDVIGRIGGDEFAVVVSSAAATTQAEVQERLERLVAQSNHKLNGMFEISLSVGAMLCDSSMTGMTVEDLLAGTDALMYEQKSMRRSHADLPSPALVA